MYSHDVKNLKVFESFESFFLFDKFYIYEHICQVLGPNQQNITNLIGFLEKFDLYNLI